MATVNSILNSINTILDDKVTSNIIINNKNKLNFSYTKTVESDGDKKSKASVSISSKNDVYDDFCDVDTFKQNLRTYITNKISTIQSNFNAQLNKTIEILIYRLITNYIYQHSTVTLIPESDDDSIIWYQKIILLIDQSKHDSDIKKNKTISNLIELNVLKNKNYSGLLEFFEKAALNKKVSNLTIS